MRRVVPLPRINAATMTL